MVQVITQNMESRTHMVQVLPDVFSSVQSQSPLPVTSVTHWPLLVQNKDKALIVLDLLE